ncbi:MAG: MBG domain-containing protein [Janthinobacterium lividum]
MLRQLQFIVLLLFLAGLIPQKAFAQFPYTNSFENATAPGANFGGSPTAYLTGGNIDANGSGYLRLTSNANSQAGYAFISSSFPATKGISVSFEYATWGGTGNADGICFFLFDGSLADASFKVGQFGGSLGYSAPVPSTTNGLSKAYLGVGLDEYGNFSNAAFGAGGTGFAPNSVTIRGAYNDANGAYNMLKTVPLSTATHGFNTIGSGTARATAGNTGYRKAYIDIIPDASGIGFDITVKIQHDAVSAPVTIISNYYYSYASPATLKFGYAASTGGSNNYHEIRNTAVTLPASTTLTTPTQTNQTLTTCSNSTGSVNISSGFSTTNTPNGAINTASVDLDPSTTGIQTTYTVVSKGTFTSDGSGNITFAPLNSTVTGPVSCSFTVADNYGATSNTATVTATINAAPILTITNPAAACLPATIDITAAAVTAGSDANLTLSYYSNATATTVLSNPNAITTSGTYYIKAVNASNCSVIQPVTVTINPLPTTANAGSDQTSTTATTTSVTLSGNSPTAGTGLWSQISGPTTATFANATLYNTTAGNLNPGTYTFRWTISNSCGSSADDVTIGITGTQTITFAAIPTKTYGDSDFNAGATASSGIAITYTSINPTVATVDASGNVHILAAGSTIIKASQAGNSNYTAATAVTQTLTVNKASLTIASDNQNKVFGSVNPTLTASYTGFVNNENSNNLTTQPAISTTATTSSPVGTYPITSSGAVDDNYIVTNTPGTLTVSQSSQTITFNTLSAKTYGDTDFTLNATTSSGLPINYISSNPAVATVDASGNVHILSAGTTVITASQAGNSNYIATSVAQTLTVNKAALTLTADNQIKTYNTANPALTISYSGFVNNETAASLPSQATANTTATAASSVGTYPITVTGAASNNYQITYVNGALSVGQSSPAITFNALSAKVYGDADYSLSAISTSGLTVTYTSSNPAVATVDASGNVHILSAGTTVITASQAGNSNYNAAASVAQTLTVNKAALTITADNQTKTYNTANPALTISYSGFVNGETSSNLTTLPTIITAATTASAVGAYPVTVSGAVSNNYQITYVNGVLSVYPGTQTITFTASPKTYGDPDFALNAVASSGLPVTYSSSNTAVATVDANGLVHIVSAGNVTISALQTGNGNYIATTVINQQLTINPATLTVVADNITKAFGSANPPLTITYSGFVNGDTSTSLTTQPILSTTATTASVVGLYPILVSGAASANYRINYQSGSLIVEQDTQQITFAALSTKTYGDADFSLNAMASSGLPITYISSDSTVATVDNAGKVHILSAGNVSITASQVGNNNYKGTDNVIQTFTVNKAALTITADNQTISYGTPIPALSVHYSGFVNGENQMVLTAQPSVSTTATATSDPGTYPITVSDTTAANYTITFVAGTLTISPKAQTITAAAPTAKTYGDADFSLNASSTTTLPITYTSSNPAVATIDGSGNVHVLSAGTVVFTVFQNGNSDYTAAPPVQQTVTINKAALTITADNQSRAYGAANPAFTVTYSGFVNGENASILSTPATVGTTATTSSPSGTYPIMPSSADAANYTMLYVPGTLTINNAVISGVSFVQTTLLENQPAGTMAGTLSATSLDPNAVFTYTFITGTGAADNASFSIQGNKVLTATSMNYEQQSSYNILVRATNQYGLYLDQAFTIQITDVNEVPTLAAVPNQSVCNLTSAQKINLTAITPGPESTQTTTLSISTTNPALFSNLSVSNVSGGTAAINYTLASTGSADITITVKDNGGTANGGIDSFSQTFTLTANEVPVAAIASDKGTQVVKGQTVTLTASGGGTYSWDNASGIVGTTHSAVLQVRPSQNTTYLVTATNASGCSTTASITLNVTDDYSMVQAANILTPNGDGKNDTWVVKNIDLYPESTIIIFDKGGRRLLNVKHYNNDWDGTFQGSPLSEDTYYYVIDFGPGKAPLKGFITLLRNR